VAEVAVVVDARLEAPRAAHPVGQLAKPARRLLPGGTSPDPVCLAKNQAGCQIGRCGETAMVRAAESSMPAFGVALIVFGGLLSTMSALNATVMAASRVAFSMGRNRWLPAKLGLIDPLRRTARIAIFLTGAILLSVAVLLPLETVGSAASLMFLLIFSMVNLSVIALRRIVDPCRACGREGLCEPITAWVADEPTS
jgi:amino acid transporter